MVDRGKAIRAVPALVVSFRSLIQTGNSFNFICDVIDPMCDVCSTEWIEKKNRYHNYTKNEFFLGGTENIQK